MEISRAQDILRFSLCSSSVISVLSLRFSSFDDGGKESIRPMLRRKSPKEAVRANNALARARTPARQLSMALRGSATRNVSPNAPNTSRTTNSFSSGSSEHVEYTSRPCGARCGSAFRSKRAWRSCKSFRSSARSFHRISGCRASVPVPEQGTSTRMRSNGVRTEAAALRPER